MSFLKKFIDKEVDKRIEILIKESQNHNSVQVGNPLTWSWQSTIPDSYYPNAMLRNMSRNPTSSYKSVDGTSGITTNLQSAEVDWYLVFKNGLLVDKDYY